MNYINTIKTKVAESELLLDQAVNNKKEQFANSSDLEKSIEAAILDALTAHTTMSKQALSDPLLRFRLKNSCSVLLSFMRR